jgi:hypothetical protein
MKYRLTAMGLALSLLLFLPLNLAAAADRGKDRGRGNDPEGLSVPISGTFADANGGTGKFAGTFTIKQFAVVGNSIHAVGVIAGTLTDAQGNVIGTGLQTVSLPVTATSGTTAALPATDKSSGGVVRFAKAAYNPADGPRPMAATTATAATAQLTCPILRLSIGAIDLNLLGLVVHLNPVLLIITAVPGAGNLLGNLLCAIAGLLDPIGPLGSLVALLNQLLALLDILT